MTEETSFLSRLVAVCRAFPGIELAILFGSMAAGDGRTAPDYPSSGVGRFHTGFGQFSGNRTKGYAPSMTTIESHKLADLERVVSRLSESLALPPSDMARDSVITEGTVG